MIKQDQTILHDPENGKKGNCVAACVACIMELPVDEVPNFVESSDWATSFATFLYRHGKGFVLVTRVGLDIALEDICMISLEQYGIGIGKSPRAPEDKILRHAVVVKGFDIVHDPHPSRDGIVGELEEVIFIVDYVDSSAKNVGVF